ncbi:MAG: 3-phosphoshikimate 1-carboxyvinyltransferase [Oscillospiraceae bacterium]|nr:3-phosphoshikimate 1-carboxyvinyltransferase [Clostridiales bacterium]MDD7674073.1 3-phosphoshikimate 1-carboxyvinyltransferase [Oscillospiraceae bacterium]
MDITISPRRLRGDLTVIPSKSQAHRLLICAAFSDKPTLLQCAETNRDIEATADCLTALGAKIIRTDSGYTVFPVKAVPEQAELHCRESGSTLRFLLPVAGALGVDALFTMEGRLPQRPLSPLWEEMERMGCTLTRPTSDTIRCTGKLRPGAYRIDGGISSQYITGLLLALSLLGSGSQLEITGKAESRPYIEMTKAAISLFGGDPDHPGEKRFHSPGAVSVEGDWSNGAFFLAANELGSHLNLHGLDPDSPQGDRAVLGILPLLRSGAPRVSAADIPDLVPILSVAAASNHGAVFTDIRRLRMKESDRVASVMAMLKSLGGRAEADDNTLTVFPSGFTGGVVDSFNDHRIAMSAAIAATVCTGPVTVLGAECVSKSYPGFWEEYRRLGGNYEQHVR